MMVVKRKGTSHQLHPDSSSETIHPSNSQQQFRPFSPTMPMMMQAPFSPTMGYQMFPPPSLPQTSLQKPSITFNALQMNEDSAFSKHPSLANDGNQQPAGTVCGLSTIRSVSQQEEFHPNSVMTDFIPPRKGTSRDGASDNNQDGNMLQQPGSAVPSISEHKVGSSSSLSAAPPRLGPTYLNTPQRTSATSLVSSVSASNQMLPLTPSTQFPLLTTPTSPSTDSGIFNASTASMPAPEPLSMQSMEMAHASSVQELHNHSQKSSLNNSWVKAGRTTNGEQGCDERRMLKKKKKKASNGNEEDADDSDSYQSDTARSSTQSESDDLEHKDRHRRDTLPNDTTKGKVPTLSTNTLESLQPIEQENTALASGMPLSPTTEAEMHLRQLADTETFFYPLQQEPSQKMASDRKYAGNEARAQTKNHEYATMTAESPLRNDSQNQHRNSLITFSQSVDSSIVRRGRSSSQSSNPALPKYEANSQVQPAASQSSTASHIKSGKRTIKSSHTVDATNMQLQNNIHISPVSSSSSFEGEVTPKSVHFDQSAELSSHSSQRISSLSAERLQGSNQSRSASSLPPLAPSLVPQEATLTSPSHSMAVLPTLQENPSKPYNESSAELPPLNGYSHRYAQVHPRQGNASLMLPRSNQSPQNTSVRPALKRRTALLDAIQRSMTGLLAPLTPATTTLPHATNAWGEDGGGAGDDRGMHATWGSGDAQDRGRMDGMGLEEIVARGLQTSREDEWAEEKEDSEIEDELPEEEEEEEESSSLSDMDRSDISYQRTRSASCTSCGSSYYTRSSRASYSSRCSSASDYSNGMHSRSVSTSSSFQYSVSQSASTTSQSPPPSSRQAIGNIMNHHTDKAEHNQIDVPDRANSLFSPTPYDNGNLAYHSSSSQFNAPSKNQEGADYPPKGLSKQRSRRASEINSVSRDAEYMSSSQLKIQQRSNSIELGRIKASHSHKFADGHQSESDASSHFNSNTYSSNEEQKREVTAQLKHDVGAGNTVGDEGLSELPLETLQIVNSKGRIVPSPHSISHQKVEEEPLPLSSSDRDHISGNLPSNVVGGAQQFHSDYSINASPEGYDEYSATHAARSIQQAHSENMSGIRTSTAGSMGTSDDYSAFNSTSETFSQPDALQQNKMYTSMQQSGQSPLFPSAHSSSLTIENSQTNSQTDSPLANRKTQNALPFQLHSLPSSSMITESSSLALSTSQRGTEDVSKRLSGPSSLNSSLTAQQSHQAQAQTGDFSPLMNSTSTSYPQRQGDLSADRQAASQTAEFSASAAGAFTATHLQAPGQAYSTSGDFILNAAQQAHTPYSPPKSPFNNSVASPSLSPHSSTNSDFEPASSQGELQSNNETHSHKHTEKDSGEVRHRHHRSNSQERRKRTQHKHGRVNQKDKSKDDLRRTSDTQRVEVDEEENERDAGEIVEQNEEEADEGVITTSARNASNERIHKVRKAKRDESKSGGLVSFFRKLFCMSTSRSTSTHSSDSEGEGNADYKQSKENRKSGKNKKKTGFCSCCGGDGGGSESDNLSEVNAQKTTKRLQTKEELEEKKRLAIWLFAEIERLWWLNEIN